MMSTNRLCIHNNDIYKIIKRFYSFNFPFPVKFSAIDAINIVLKDKGTLGAPGKFELDPNGNVIFIIESSVAQAHNKFKNPSDCQALVKDVEQLQQWLEKYGFIDGMVATPKFISTTDLNF
ncbi:hypothetical protein [Pantoea sp. S62]|uniref:hypothetical protein n=1 Tax=Pantoea sp. S62 TaxID=2769342 RepID=UPI001913A822|nr:hypothetical protein [Pantoea sp. S62]MBK5017288.1 hypothetical protein [Pantoea sp. S62]